MMPAFQSLLASLLTSSEVELMETVLGQGEPAWVEGFLLTSSEVELMETKQLDC